MRSSNPVNVYTRDPADNVYISQKHLHNLIERNISNNTFVWNKFSKHF